MDCSRNPIRPLKNLPARTRLLPSTLTTLIFRYMVLLLAAAAALAALPKSTTPNFNQKIGTFSD